MSVADLAAEMGNRTIWIIAWNEIDVPDLAEMTEELLYRLRRTVFKTNWNIDRHCCNLNQVFDGKALVNK